MKTKVDKKFDAHIHTHMRLHVRTHKGGVIGLSVHPAQCEKCKIEIHCFSSVP